MLKVRVIPTLLWKDFGLVKGVRFDSWRRVGSVLPAIKVYNARDVDELVLVDITASSAKRSPDHESVTDFADECSVPLTVGGGICEHGQIVALLRAGADKVAINTAAVQRPELVRAAAERFGAQAIVVAVDARQTGPGRWEVFVHGGRTPTGRDAVAWCEEAAALGAGELLLTSMDRDGTRAGYDLELTRTVSDRVTVPVIASGGVGELEHLAAGFLEGHADAVLAASIFHFGEHTVGEAKRYLAGRGVPVRP